MQHTVECSQSSCISKAWNQRYLSKRITVTPFLQCVIQEPKDQEGPILTGPGAHQAPDFMSGYLPESAMIVILARVALGSQTARLNQTKQIFCSKISGADPIADLMLNN